ncbi:nitrate ABC transporter ATPase [Leuconostoc mesenteroides]|uniref:nitrate ABC transporter ATPase n=1 Tax=Leuconostoc mesenteroides TaxID=1245 RepID=UPI001CBEC3A1|nr:nitrate ABC transporter ATPase [Leuconostoc mesenteroides]MBZ1528466.1 nitrate ABC transporter ATPase [Leuconostoc mesenteroides]
MNPKIKDLLDNVNGVYPGTVMTRVNGGETGELHIDQVSQEILGQRLLIEIANKTESDFLLGNELSKMLLTLNGIAPQVFFALTFNDGKLDDQLIQIATRMHRTVVHAITYRELAKQGITTSATVKAYFSGLNAELTPENGEVDDESLWRLLMILDALVFANTISDSSLVAELQQKYPLAYTAASSLIKPVMAADLKQARNIRHQMVSLFEGIDEVLTRWGKPTVNAKEYVTLTSVLSKRQLDLPVNQVFTIYHSEMTDFQTQKTAYVGLSKNDNQNSFVVSPPDNEADKPTFFKELYALKVSELFQKLALPYIERD